MGSIPNSPSIEIYSALEYMDYELRRIHQIQKKISSNVNNYNNSIKALIPYTNNNIINIQKASDDVITGQGDIRRSYMINSTNSSSGYQINFLSYLHETAI